MSSQTIPTVLTRHTFKNLEGVESTKCRGCQQYYGPRKELYLCSSCSGSNQNDSQHISEDALTTSNFRRKLLSKKTNFKIFPEAIFKNILHTTKSVALYRSGENENMDSYFSEIIDTNRNLLNQYESRSDIPQKFLCPITQNFIKQPVYLESENGHKHYFEFSAIYEWLQDKKTHPLTRDYCQSTDLKIDSDFTKEMFEWKKENATWYLFSDQQAAKLATEINWSVYSKGHRISHMIVKNRAFPWTDHQKDKFHPSSYCYYGNYMEIPKTINDAKKFIFNNLNPKTMIR
jgi:hypothetical protein